MRDIRGLRQFGEVTPDQMWEHRLTPPTPVPGLYLAAPPRTPAGA
jgi:hypothetical protein